MKKEDFFEILGELDGSIVEAAKTPIEEMPELGMDACREEKADGKMSGEENAANKRKTKGKEPAGRRMEENGGQMEENGRQMEENGRWMEENGGRKASRKKKIGWKIWGVAAACVILACTVLYFSQNGKGKGEGTEQAREGNGEETEQAAGDIAPMVYVNDTLYIQSGGQQGDAGWKEEYVYLGKIESTVSTEGEPRQNFQANDPIVGSEVYQYGEKLAVKINGAYWIYVTYREEEYNWEELSEEEKGELDPTYEPKIQQNDGISGDGIEE